MIQDFPFLLLTIYAPNKSVTQSDFFQTISEELKGLFTFSDFSVVIGEDFSVIFDQNLIGGGGGRGGGGGGLKKAKGSLMLLEDICVE